MTRTPWAPDELALLRTKQPAKTIAARLGRSVTAVWSQAFRQRDVIGYRYPQTCACGRRHYARGRCLRCYKRELRRLGAGRGRA